jgi:hypothetical protein
MIVQGQVVAGHERSRYADDVGRASALLDSYRVHMALGVLRPMLDAGDDPTALRLGTIAYAQLGEFERALGYSEQLARIESLDRSDWLRRAAASVESCRWDDARTAIAHVDELVGPPFNELFTLANVHWCLGHRTSYQKVVDKILRRHFRHPRDVCARSYLRLRAGDYVRGWYDRAFPAGVPTPRNWDGGRLNGTLVLTQDGGYGDTLQMVPLLPEVASRVRRVVLATLKPGLTRLLVSLLPRNVEFVPHGTAIAHVSAHTLLWCHLPAILRVTVDNFPSGPVTDFGTMGPRLPAPFGSRCRVGMVWAGDPATGHDRRRSCPLAALEPIWSLPDVECFALQVGDRALAQLAGTPVVPLRHLISDFADTAALLQQLDVLVAVDTSVAHLGGVLGIPTILLLEHGPEWRWGMGGGDSVPWYSSMRPAYQSHPGDWTSAACTAASLIAAWPVGAARQAS